MLILAVDTSCDDTAAAVTRDTTVLSNVIASQAELHRPYGGVFPTVAKLAHRENILPTIALALRRARVEWKDLDALAVTQGPGLAPALEVGIETAKSLATEHNLPVIPVNHIEGHLLSPLAEPLRKKPVKNDAQVVPESAARASAPHFPTLGIIVSGGHTQFVLVHAIGDYKILGATVDDAAGECLDKIGRMLNLGYPAGAIMEQFAKKGNPRAIPFPLPMTTSRDYNLSFSGLKTFARNKIEASSGVENFTQQEIFDWCASTQFAVFRHITHKLAKLLKNLTADSIQLHEIWLGGGVAANMTLRSMIRKTVRAWHHKEMTRSTGGLGDAPTAGRLTSRTATATLHLPKLRTPYTKRLCMDNAAMIGVAAGLRLRSTSKVSEKLLHNLPENGESIERKPRLKLTASK